MLATTKDTALPGIFAALIGAALALGAHLLKVRYRRPLATLYGGVLTPVASVMEDVAVLLISLRRAARAVIGGLVLAALTRPPRMGWSARRPAEGAAGTPS